MDAWQAGILFSIKFSQTRTRIPSDGCICIILICLRYERRDVRMGVRMKGWWSVEVKNIVS